MASRWNVRDHARDEGRLDKAVDRTARQGQGERRCGDAGRFIRDLRRELLASANHIEVAAGSYNVAVQRFNTLQKPFPYSVIGHRLHLRPRPVYNAPAEPAVGRSPAAMQKR